MDCRRAGDRRRREFSAGEVRCVRTVSLRQSEERKGFGRFALIETPSIAANAAKLSQLRRWCETLRRSLGSNWRMELSTPRRALPPAVEAKQQAETSCATYCGLNNSEWKRKERARVNVALPALPIGNSGMRWPRSGNDSPSVPRCISRQPERNFAKHCELRPIVFGLTPP